MNEWLDRSADGIALMFWMFALLGAVLLMAVVLQAIHRLLCAPRVDPEFEHAEAAARYRQSQERPPAQPREALPWAPPSGWIDQR